MIQDFKPDFLKVYIKANELLVSSNIINEFPFSVTQFVKTQSSIPCRKFSKAKEYGVDIEAFGSESAVTIKDEGNKTIIFYNHDQLPQRVKFSILHEFGHIYLGHNFNEKDLIVYNNNEVETNCFSAQLLMPEQVLKELKLRGITIDEEFLMQTFGVSKLAAEKRMENLFKNSSNRTPEEKMYDDIILAKFMPWINSIVPPRFDNLFEDEEERQREREQWKYKNINRR